MRTPPFSAISRGVTTSVCGFFPVVQVLAVMRNCSILPILGPIKPNRLTGVPPSRATALPTRFTLKRLSTNNLSQFSRIGGARSWGEAEGQIRDGHGLRPQKTPERNQRT